jgi:hypothetical protein
MVCLPALIGHSVARKPLWQLTGGRAGDEAAWSFFGERSVLNDRAQARTGAGVADSLSALPDAATRCKDRIRLTVPMLPAYVTDVRG